MLINRRIAIKVMVTDQFKTRLIDKLKQALNQVDLPQRTLEQRGRQFLSELLRKDESKGESFREKLDRQLKEQAEIRARLAEELAKAENLNVGEEYLQDHVDGLVAIHVGDNLSERLAPAEILVRDGIVVQIRR